MCFKSDIYIVLAMSDSSEKNANEGCSKRTLDPGDPKVCDDPPDLPKKRSRGPMDCLNWDDSDEEEFVPFTQSNPEVVWETPPRLPVEKAASTVSRAKNSAAKNGRGKKSASIAKGKSLGKQLSYI